MSYKLSKMDSHIKKLLKDNYHDGIFFTHVSQITPKGKYQFNRQTLEEFWEYYCKLIYNEEDPVIGIAEKPHEYLPILVDVDLKVKDDGEIVIDKGLYGPEHIKLIIQVYQSVLRTLVDDCSDNDLICVVLEKDMYIESKNNTTYFKNGFHLHFPYCFISKINQELHIIPKVKKELKEMKVFSYLGIDDSGNVIDKNACNVTWLLYGSRKAENRKPYLFTKVFDANLNEISLYDAFKNYTIFDNKERAITFKDSNNDKIKFYLPRILSIVPYGRKTKELNRMKISIMKERKEENNRDKSSAVNQNRFSVEKSLEVAKRIMPMIADFRSSDYNEWMTIGWALYNISEGSPNGLELWCDFSSRCQEKYNEDACVYAWDRMIKKDIGLGTLIYYAKTDNPAEYAKYKEEESGKYIKDSLEGSHNDIAKLLYVEYGDEFVCSSVANKHWYQFVGHKWEKIEEGIFLRQKISGRVIQKYIKAIKLLYTELGTCNDKAKENVLNTKIKQISKMIQNLKSSPYKNNIMKECMEVFYDSKFQHKLDKDPYLIAFKNGVYDLKNNIFRHGRPEDYISKSMNIDYIEYNENDEIVEKVYTFLEQIFPDPSLREYFMNISSDIFVGGNHEKTVVFWTGEGDNGKSIMQQFFEMMLGPLAIKLNTNVITGKKPSAGSAYADLARAGNGVRWAVLEEPDGDESINIGIFKHLSGNDTFYARDLYEKGKDTNEIKGMFKLTFICNKLPRMKYADKAVWNRGRVLPFESTFCKSGYPETYEEQLAQKRFPCDKNFSKKIPDMLPAFAWILLEHRKKLQKNPKNYIEPQKVISATEQYRKQNDIYMQFIEESIVEDANSIISLLELYNIFKDWFRTSMPGFSIPVKNDIEEYFTKLWGSPEKAKKWKGYRQRTLQDDISSGLVVEISDELIEKTKKKYNNALLQ